MQRRKSEKLNFSLFLCFFMGDSGGGGGGGDACVVMDCTHAV